MFKAFHLLNLPTLNVFILCTIILCQQAQAETINLVAEFFPPQTNHDGTGQQFDIARAIFEPLGYTININVYPYRRVILLLESKQADIAVGVAKVGNQKLLFSKLPHDSDNLIAIYPKNSPVIWQGMSSLSGKRISFIAGLTEGLSLDLDLSKFKVSEVNTREQALKKLLMARDDFLIDCECGFLLSEVVAYRSQFTVKNIGFIKIYAAFSHTKKGMELKEIWQREFPKFIKSKTAHDIYKKWGLMREYGIIKRVLQNHEFEFHQPLSTIN